MHRFIATLVLIIVTLSAPLLRAQGSKADYERAATLESRTRDKLLNTSPDYQWLSPTTVCFALTAADGSRTFETVDAATGLRQPLFDHAALATQLASLIPARFDASNLPIESIASHSDCVAILLSTHTRPIAVCNGAARFISDAEPNPFLLTPLATPRRSVSNSSNPVALIFTNNLSQPATLFWITSSNQRRQYATIKPGDTHRQNTFAGHVWVACDPTGKDIVSFAAETRRRIAVIQVVAASTGSATPESPESITATPSTADRLFLKEGNIWLRPPNGSGDVALTTDGTSAHPYTDQIITSPDSNYAVVVRTRRAAKRKVYYVESSPTDQLQPKLHSYDYPKPGDELDTPQPVLVDIAARRVHTFDSPLLSNPWSIDRFVWSADSTRCLFLLNQRGHQVQHVLSIHASTHTLTSILEERSNTFIDYSQKTAFHYLPQTDEFIWMSERSGYNHLYLVHATTGAITPITSGNWVVRAIDSVDRDRRSLTLRIMGIDADQDPYHVHFARVNFDGTGFTRLTQGDGTHAITPSPGGEYLIDQFSRADLPPVTELRRSSDGSFVAQLNRVDWNALCASGWMPPQRFVAKGRDGRTDIWGLIHRPSNFDSNRKYPVIEAIYAGPHGQHVPKTFRAHSRPAELAELGFIVVQIDGMGTNWRSKAFHDVAWKNLHDAGFPDRIAWLKSAAAAHPELDLNNHGRGVGIFGGSAGGQNALAALLWHGDFYKVAAADCGCHDNRMDKVWWNEAWMSWPIGPEYEASSNVANAHRLPDDAHLLLTVGEMDENVDPASTMQVADALIKAGKDFDLIVLPGMGHGAGESPYAARRRADFFVRHLMGVEPRWQPK